MDLGDRVVRAAVGAKAVGARAEVRLPDRLEHQLERGLHHAVPHGRDAQPAHPAAGLGDHPFPHGQGNELAGLQIGPQLGEEGLLAAHHADVAGGRPVHSGGARPLVAPHPVPCHPQESRVGDEVEQIIKSAAGLLGRPSVQLGLDPQYPRPRLIEARPRRAGIHRRPPGMPARPLLTCCRPWPCARLSRARTTTAAPPRSRAIGRRRARPPPTWPAGG